MTLGISLLTWMWSQPTLTQLQQVQATGSLKVITRNGPTSYYEGPHGPTGFEYDLVAAFAQHLGVQLDMTVAKTFSAVLSAPQTQSTDFAAAGITVTDKRQQTMQFSDAFLKAAPYVVYRAGATPLEDINALLDAQLVVIADSSYEEQLELHQQQFPQLDWETAQTHDIEQLLAEVEAGSIQATIADSHILNLHRRYYPNLRRGVRLGDPKPLAWAFPPGSDHSLRNAANQFLLQFRQSGRLERLKRQYFGQVAQYRQQETFEFRRNLVERLPDVQHLFEQAGAETGVPWTLLAAISYQESHWRKNAISPTGVRGLMMLTLNTARALGVDRNNPEESVLGGARYFLRMKSRIPDRIREPDRTWLALAAYNVGRSHLEDARILTQRRGFNPDVWEDVAKHLPLLSDPEIYPTLKHGYARGREPVRYVENIRNYQDIIKWWVARDLPAGTAADV